MEAAYSSGVRVSPLLAATQSTPPASASTVSAPTASAAFLNQARLPQRSQPATASAITGAMHSSTNQIRSTSTLRNI